MTTTTTPTTEILNAVIDSVTLSITDHGFLDVWLHLTHSRGMQGFGGYALHLPKDSKHYRFESVAGHHIYRIMQVAGVTSWDQLKGKNIRVKLVDDLIRAVGHIIREDWFCPREDYADYRKDAQP